MSFLGRQEQDLTKIAKLQRRDGSFALDDRLAAVVGLSIHFLRQESEESEWEDDAWATAVVLAYFAMRISDMEADWRVLAKKCRHWFAEYPEEQVEDMVDRASELFPCC